MSLSWDISLSSLVGQKIFQIIMFCFPQVIAVVDSITAPGGGDTLALAAGQIRNHIIRQKLFNIKGTVWPGEIGLKV